MERETNDQLAKNGLIAELQYKTSKVKEAELANRNEIEQKRLKFAHDSIDPQLASRQAAVDQAKQLAKLRADQVEALHVRAGMSGVLQQLPVQIGQRVKVGDNLARVADPTKLKAQVKIAETHQRHFGGCPDAGETGQELSQHDRNPKRSSAGGSGDSL